MMQKKLVQKFIKRVIDIFLHNRPQKSTIPVSTVVSILVCHTG